MEQIDFLKGFLIAHSVLFIIAMIFVAQTSLADPKEKKRQLWFSLLVPLIGPFITIFVHWSDIVKPAKRSVGRFENQTQPASDLLYAAYVTDGFGHTPITHFGSGDCSQGSGDGHCHT